jgi:KaiC domain protein
VSEDDDWFEEALEDEDDQSGADGEHGRDDDGSGRGSDPEPGAGPEPSPDPDGGPTPGPETGPGSESGSGADPGTASDAGGPFDEDFTTAFEEAGSGGSGGATGGTSTGSPGRGSGFGGAAGDGVFDNDFGSAFESGDDEFADENFESEIPRIDLGIEGLDEMVQGGIPERHLLVAVGSPGTGKTTFGLQFLHHGLQQGDSGVFLTLEQSREAILDTASERDWEFDRYEAEDRLAVVDLNPVEMANSLDNIRGELPGLVEEFGADRLVLDSVSLLEMMYDDPARRRTEVFDFTRSLKEAGVTTFLTSEASESNPYASRYGVIEYLTDAVFVLQYVRSESQEARLAVEIQKIRNANHSRELKPYNITAQGISVYQQTDIF